MASIRKTEVGTYTVHWREPGGRTARQRKQTFRLKGDAQAFAHSIESDKSKGQYADPSRGTLTFSEYVALWMMRNRIALGRLRATSATSATTSNRHSAGVACPTSARPRCRGG